MRNRQRVITFHWSIWKNNFPKFIIGGEFFEKLSYIVLWFNQFVFQFFLLKIREADENIHSLSFRIPTNKEKRATWLRNLRRDGSSPSSATRICSDHILEKYIDRSGERTILKPGAVPTRFKKFPEHLKTKTPIQRRPLIRKTVTSSTQSIDSTPELPPPSPSVAIRPEPEFVPSSSSCSSAPTSNTKETPRTLKKVISRKDYQLQNVRHRLKIQPFIS